MGYPRLSEVFAVPYALIPDNSDREDPAEVICSAQRCRALAHWAVVWNNPKIHTPDREKIWTACDVHRETLRDYLTSHSMNLIRVQPLAEVAPPEPHP